MKVQIGAMSVGDILDRGLKMLFARLGTFVTINLVAYSPYLVFQILQPVLFKASQAAEGGPDMAAGALMMLLVGTLLGLLVYVVAVYIGTAATLHVIVKEFVDEHVTVGQALAAGWSRAGALFWSLLLVGLLVMLGTLLCIVPAILFSIWYCFVAQVVVAERLSGPAALERSKKLTEGFRWRIVGVSMLIGLINLVVMIPFIGLQLALPSVRSVPGPGGFVRQLPVYPNYYINTLAQFLPVIIISAYGAICFTLLYFDVRIRKEGFDLMLLAKPKTEPLDELA